MPSGLTLGWLFAQHNEHRLVTTRLLIWVLYKLDGWNVATHQVINFFVYGVIIACLIYAAALVFGERKSLTAAHWAVLSMTLGTLAVLASIAAGRYGFGPLQAKSTRYAEFGMALVPLSALAWGFALRKRKLAKSVALAALWVLCFAAFWDN